MQSVGFGRRKPGRRKPYNQEEMIMYYCVNRFKKQLNRTDESKYMTDEVESVTQTDASELPVFRWQNFCKF